MNQELIDNKNKMIELTIFVNETLRRKENIIKWSYYATQNYLILKFDTMNNLFCEIIFDFEKNIESLKEQFLYHFERNKKWLQ